jgi:hypothetical protein
MTNRGLVGTLILGSMLAATLAPVANATPAGELYGSGDNEYGQLGIGEPSDEYAFLPISGPASVLAASPGQYATLALLANGTVVASGRNAHGELGDETTEQHSTPQKIAGLSEVTSVAEGESQSFALLANGTVEAWGHNSHGQLGDGEANTTGCECRTSPTLVKGLGGNGTLSGVVAISSGVDDAIALLSNGTVVAWGDGGYGELGDGAEGVNATSVVPVLVRGIGGEGTLSGVVAISAGAYDNLALLANGSVVAWGDGTKGELGDGADATSDVPVLVKGVGGVGELSNVSAVSAGDFFNLALLSNGTVAAWGSNESYELGQDTTERSDLPDTVPGTAGVSAIAAGANFVQALLTTGTLEGWGQDEHGELGTGTYSLGEGAEGEVRSPTAATTLVPGAIYSLTHGDDNEDSLVLQGATLTAASPSLAFPEQAIGTQSTPQSVTITNEGPGAVIVSGEVVTDSAEFDKIADSCQGATLVAGATCSVSVSFSPSAAGIASASLALASSAGTTPLTVSFAGVGVGPKAAAPVLGSLSLSSAVFRAAATGPSILSAVASGTLVYYTDSTVATTKFTVKRVVKGVVDGAGKCVAAHKRRRKGVPRCTLLEAVGSFSHKDRAGTNSFRFTGRVDGHRLKRGSYRLVAVATSPAGASKPKKAKFKIVGH